MKDLGKKKKKKKKKKKILYTFPLSFHISACALLNTLLSNIPLYGSGGFFADIFLFYIFILNINEYNI